MPTVQAQIDQATERLNQLKQKKRKIDARKRAAEQKKQRQIDTRRKILAGALMLDMQKNGQTRNNDGRDWLLERLNQYLTKPADRELFDLPND